MPLACRVFGHRYRFSSEGRTMRWACQRCGTGSSKEYASPAEAARFAEVFDREDSDSLGKRAPLFGLFPLRMWRWLRSRA